MIDALLDFMKPSFFFLRFGFVFHYRSNESLKVKIWLFDPSTCISDNVLKIGITWLSKLMNNFFCIQNSQTSILVWHFSLKAYLISSGPWNKIAEPAKHWSASFLWTLFSHEMSVISWKILVLFIPFSLLRQTLQRYLYQSLISIRMAKHRPALIQENI